MSTDKQLGFSFNFDTRPKLGHVLHFNDLDFVEKEYIVESRLKTRGLSISSLKKSFLDSKSSKVIYNYEPQENDGTVRSISIDANCITIFGHGTTWGAEYKY